MKCDRVTFDGVFARVRKACCSVTVIVLYLLRTRSCIEVTLIVWRIFLLESGGIGFEVNLTDSADFGPCMIFLLVAVPHCGNSLFQCS